MNRIVLAFLALLSCAALSAQSTCEIPALYEPHPCGSQIEYNGYYYETVQIGGQCWFAENLRTEHYRNGDAIPAGLSDAEWAGTAEGAVSVYDGDMANLSTYGRLYNWYAVVENRFLCPIQWHVPSDQEWTQLKAYATIQGWDGFEGTALKSTGGWSGFNGTDHFGFSALPGGVRASEISVFLGVGNESSFWTSSSILNPDSYAAFHYQTAQGVGSYSSNRLHQDGLSIRCIKDQ